MRFPICLLYCLTAPTFTKEIRLTPALWVKVPGVVVPQANIKFSFLEHTSVVSIATPPPIASYDVSSSLNHTDKGPVGALYAPPGPSL